MIIVDQQHMEAKRLQNLVGSVDKARRFLLVGRSFGVTADRRCACDADADQAGGKVSVVGSVRKERAGLFRATTQCVQKVEQPQSDPVRISGVVCDSTLIGNRQ
jgi:hypothetical protein